MHGQIFHQLTATLRVRKFNIIFHIDKAVHKVQSDSHQFCII